MRLLASTFTILLLLSMTSAMGATLNLNAVASNGSRFFEHRQGAFWELGQTRESTRVEHPDGAFSYSELPNYVPQGGGGTAFPNMQDFTNLGVIEYDEATGAITDLEFDFEPHVAPGRFTFYQAISQASPYVTSFNSFSGTVTFNGSALAAINFTSEIVFSIDGSEFGDGILSYTGTLNVSDNAFALDVDDTNYSQAYEAFSGDGNLRVEWNVSGMLTPLVEGDFDLDGDIDGLDFLLWQHNPSIGDLADWETNFGTGTTGPAPAVVVPEPTGILLIAFSSSSVLIGRQRAVFS